MVRVLRRTKEAGASCRPRLPTVPLPHLRSKARPPAFRSRPQESGRCRGARRIHLAKTCGHGLSLKTICFPGRVPLFHSKNGVHHACALPEMQVNSGSSVALQADRLPPIAPPAVTCSLPQLRRALFCLLLFRLSTGCLGSLAKIPLKRGSALPAHSAAECYRL